MKRITFIFIVLLMGVERCICPVLHMDLQHGRKYSERIENQITIKA